MNNGQIHHTHRVLIVDDDPIERDMLVELLSAPHRQVEAFGSATLAWDYVQEHPVDFALLDHMMPGMSGADLAAKLKGKYPAMRVIMCTGYLIEAGNPALRGVCDQVLHKPLKLGEILELANADAKR